MPRKKTSTPDPGERRPTGTDAEIRRRLAEWLRDRYGNNISRAAAVAGVSRSTMDGWLKSRAKSLPKLDNLRRLAQHGLSIDWLITGHGSMQSKRLETTTDKGALLDLLRPHLQRLANVGEFTDDQAFDRLVAELGAEGMLELAASGLFARYSEYVAELRRLHEAAQMWAWTHQHLEALIAAMANGDAVKRRDELRALSERIEEVIPGSVAARRAHDRFQQRLVKEATDRGLRDDTLINADYVLRRLEGVTKALDRLDATVLQQQQQGALSGSIEGIRRALARLESDFGLCFGRSPDSPPQTSSVNLTETSP